MKKKSTEHNKKGNNSWSLNRLKLSKVLKYLLKIKKIMNVKLKPKKMDAPPILTIGLVWIFLLLGLSRKLNFLPILDLASR